MSLADISIKRPTFITCLIFLMLAVGLFSIKKLGVDLFPDVTFPIVFVSTPYPGAGPSEIETLVSKPLEEEISTLAGIKRLSSTSQEGVSTVIAEFSLETDIKFAEQQIRDRVSSTKRKLPTDIKEPVIRRIDPADQPIVILSMSAKGLSESQMFDIADESIRPKIEQINQVGLVYVLGARKREVRVELDRAKLKSREVSATSVANRLASAGENIPAGKVEQGSKETVMRTIGQFQTLNQIKSYIIGFFGSERPLTVGDVAKVEDSMAEEKSRVFVNGEKSLFIYVFKQSGANTVAVADTVKERMEALNKQLSLTPGSPFVKVIRDGSVFIRANIEDVKESIIIGISLAVIVVFFFLGSGRSTIITALALPNSLIGAFILMWIAGYTINLMTLLALSLAVGLLIDDAIVVRENIFRHIEMGKSPLRAAIEGTKEVSLAVIATTLTVIAVFGPVAFLKGVVGQFFKQFGFVVCFAMMISLFDALTIAPMLSAYFAGKHEDKNAKTIWNQTVGKLLNAFNRFQDWLENVYEDILKFTVRRPMLVLLGSFVVFVLSMYSGKWVPKTFLPPQDNGEFTVAIDLPPGASLDATAKEAEQIDKIIRSNSEVEVSALTVGNKDGESNLADFYVKLIPAKQRKLNTSQVKEKLRSQFVPFAKLNPKVKDYDAVGGGQRPFNLNIVGQDQAQLEKITLSVFERLKKNPGLKDIDVNFRPGKPELQVALNEKRAEELGVSPVTAGLEIRNLIEGSTPAKFREAGREYDIRVRLKDTERDLKKGFNSTFVPNLNGQLIKLSDVASPIEAVGPSKINRQDRGRYIQIQADITPGAGMGDIMKDIETMFASDPTMKLPEGMRYAFVGQAENFKELAESMLTAITFGVLFIFLVLASLYESFVTPLTIMLALPLAFSGSIVALAITQESLNIFSMIGVIMLLGVAVKNSILLVDYANQLILEGLTRNEAIIKAGRTRLRPILMTTLALIAGTIPIALGLNEASRQRTSMGVAIIGGLVSSTLLTLIVVPAAYSYIDRFRVWCKTALSKLVGVQESETAHKKEVDA